MSFHLILCTSCCDVSVEPIIKGILTTDNLPPQEDCIPGLRCYPWSIDTRYYTASVFICDVNDKNLRQCISTNNVQAFVIQFNSAHLDSFNNVKEWLSVVDEFNPEIRILLCTQCQESDENSKEDLWNWCVEHSFELVELCPASVEDEDDGFQEAVGICRVTEALSTHSWPNMVMKDSPMSAQMGVLRKEYFEQKPCESVRTEAVGQTSYTPGDHQNQKGLGEHASAGLSIVDASKTCEVQQSAGASLTEDKDELEMEEFEKLFEKLHEMRVSTEHMSADERRKHAEKVTLEFWRALGGDEDEIAGLDEDKE